MNKATPGLGLGLALLASAGPTHAGPRVQKVIVYDAETGEFTRQLRRVPPPEPPPAAPLFDPSPFYDASDAVTMEIARARCDDPFKVDITAHPVLEVKAEVRGLDEAQGLITGLLGAPPAKGAADEGLTLPEVGVLVDQLADAQGAAALRQELEEDLRHLDLALQLQRHTLEEYERDLDELMSHPLHRVETRISALRTEMGNRSGALSRCEQLWPLVQRGDQLLIEVRGARARIADRLGGMPDPLVTDLELLTRRVRTYQDKLERVRQAVDLAGRALNNTTGIGACEGGPCLPIAAVLARQKRLKEAFGDVVGDEALRQVVSEYQAFRREDRAQLQDRLGKLALQTRPESPGTLAARARALEEEVRTVTASTRALRDAFADEARELDGDAAYLLGEVNRAYETNRMTRVVGAVGPHTTNQVLIVKVSGKRPTRRPLASSATLTGPPSPSAGEPTPDDFVEIASHRFDVHKAYRWTIAGAVMGSSRKEPTFAVRSVPRLDGNGQEVEDDEGDVIKDKTVVQVDEERPLDFALLLHYYLRKQDVFPGATNAGFNWGLTGGVSIQSPEDDQYLGVFLQPTDGIQLVGGLNLANRTKLQDGVTVGAVLEPDATEPPLTKERHLGVFFGASLDIRIFKRLFGGGS